MLGGQGPWSSGVPRGAARPHWPWHSSRRWRGPPGRCRGPPPGLPPRGGPRCRPPRSHNPGPGRSAREPRRARPGDPGEQLARRPDGRPEGDRLRCPALLLPGLPQGKHVRSVMRHQIRATGTGVSGASRASNEAEGTGTGRSAVGRASGIGETAPCVPARGWRSV